MSGRGATGSEAVRSPSTGIDVCVIGAGVAGGLVAHSLADAGANVVVLEAGPRFDFASRLDRMERAIRPDIDADVWDMGGERDKFTAASPNDYNLNAMRVKGVGGTTLHWAGFTPRLHLKDFEMKSRFGLASDWAIDYEDLMPYYAKAERALGVAGAMDNPFSPPRETSFPLPPFPTGPIEAKFREACEELDLQLHSAPQARNSESFDGRSKCLGFNTCSPVCPSGAKYSGDVHIKKAENSGARVIDRAPVQYLDPGRDGNIDAAVYRTPKGEFRQRARQFVLAAGGVETPRLLLLSSQKLGQKWPAPTEAVGKYFMEHPSVSVSGTIPRPTEQEPMFWWPLESHQLYSHDTPGPGSIKLEFKHSSSVGPTRALRGFDSSAQQDLMDPINGDRLHIEPSMASEWQVTVTGLVEMLPDSTNEIRLDREKQDEYGNPVPELDFSVGTYALESLQSVVDIGTNILQEMGASEIRKGDPSDPRFPAHHMGTTRMGTNPRRSVVTPALRSHHHDNLYISSSSVFVTGGAMNPTLTIAALSLRLAEHLKSRLGIH